MSASTKESAGTDTRWYFDAEDHVVGLGWSPDATRIAALTGGGTLFLLDAAEGKPVHRLPDTHGLGACALSWSSAGVIATGGQDGRARLWDAATGTIRATLDGSAEPRRAWVEHLQWSPDGKTLATTAGKTLRLWNVAGELLAEHPGHPSTLAALCWRPDGQGVAVGFYGGVACYRLGEEEPYEGTLWKGSILSLAWSPTARYLAGGTQEATVNFWRLPIRPAEQLHMSGYANKVKELAWDAAGRFLATGGGEEVTVWDVSGKGPRGTTPKQLRAHTRKVTALAYQPRSGTAMLASGDADGNACLWRPEKTLKPLREGWLGGAISALAWAPPDGDALAVGSASGGVMTWAVGPA